MKQHRHIRHIGKGKSTIRYRHLAGCQGGCDAQLGKIHAGKNRPELRRHKDLGCGLKAGADDLSRPLHLERASDHTAGIADGLPFRRQGLIPPCCWSFREIDQMH